RLLEPAFVGSNPTAPANYLSFSNEFGCLDTHTPHLETFFDQHSSWLVVGQIKLEIQSHQGDLIDFNIE
ncbi:uncharacterized protein METZ01_LOCUS66149, partial [marine metagenome]